MKLKLFSSASVNMGFPKVSDDLDSFVNLIKLGDYLFIYIEEHLVSVALADNLKEFPFVWEEEHEIELKGPPEPPVTNIKPYESPGYVSAAQVSFSWNGAWTAGGYNWVIGDPFGNVTFCG